LYLVAAGVLTALTTAPVRAADGPEDILRKAQTLQRQEKISRAAELYTKFLKDHAGHSQALDAHYGLAQCLDALGLVDEVPKCLQAIIDSKNKRYRHRQDAFYMLGKHYASLKTYDKAVSVFEKMLSEGAGLHEDEVLNLCASYYAILKKYEDAAAKFNILKRRKNSRYAEQAAYKLCVLWLRVEDLDLAVDAVEDLASRFPQNKQARAMMFQVANLFRKKRQFSKAIGACEQLKTLFPRSREALAVGYIVGLCHRDRKQYNKAVAALDTVAGRIENRKSGLAAEALFESAGILYSNLNKPDEAMKHYVQTASLARSISGERQGQILEQCYFHLAEYNYRKQKWAAALEYYLFLRKLGTKINILPRILACQAALDKNPMELITTEEDIAYVKKKIEQNPGSLAAAEAEVFLLDRELKKNNKATADALAGKYQALLKKYSKDVLAQTHLASYIYLQAGSCYTAGKNKEDAPKAIALFEKALAAGDDSPYKIPILEGIAHVADLSGDRAKAFATYQKLFKLSGARAKADAKDTEARTQTLEYLKSMLTRVDTTDSVKQAIATAQRIMNEKGQFSEIARHAMFYVGELQHMRKDYSASAATFKKFVKAYGPKQDTQGEVANPPWKPAKTDPQIEQVYQAAIHVAHSWYLQGHTKNMLEAYQWIVRNFPNSHKHAAEARYWVLIDTLKGKAGKEPETRTKAAEGLWTQLVHPGFNFGSRDFAGKYHPWVRDEATQRYVKAAILKAGELYSELRRHERAADIFGAYLALYSPSSSRRRKGRSNEDDEMFRIARYAQGREYIALGDIPAMISCYGAYIDSARDDRFRGSALHLLAHHAAKMGDPSAVDAYATLLDEYGQNDKDAEGKIIPLPRDQWIRQGKSSRSRPRWDGVRIAPPRGLDLSKVRFALALYYWNKKDWGHCARVLAPFSEDPRLFDSKVRDKALYMAGRSYFNISDFARSSKALTRLIRDHGSFGAMEEVYVFAARAALAGGNWAEVTRLCETFNKKWKRSPNRPHMDLYWAAAALRQGNTGLGVKRLQSIASSDTYQDVKGSAEGYLAGHFMARKPPDYKTALKHYTASLTLYPRLPHCLAAAKCCIALKRWKEARDLLVRTTREFPGGDRHVLHEAKRLLPGVMKKLAN
jgi:tetratricopeptide (TPR) repeat protein